MDLSFIDKELYRKMFGVCVMEYRKTLGLTCKKLGALAGISESHLRRIESGRTLVRESTRQKLVAALGISEDREQRLIEVARIRYIDEFTRTIWSMGETFEERGHGQS